jgi:Co/Zn/Cd efflux system component
MMIVWIIGLILSFLGIYLFKNSRHEACGKTWEHPALPERPVLKVWSLFLFILGALIPIINIIMAIVMIIWWAIAVYGEEEWLFKENSIADKFMKFLSKPVK